MPGGGKGGKTQSSTSTQTTQYLPGQKEFFTDAYKYLGPLLGNFQDIKFPVTDPVANASRDTTASQGAIRSNVNANGAQFGQDVLGANKFLLSDVLFPGSNPALQGTIDAAINPVQDRLMRNILPSIRSAYTSGDASGSSRQGIAEGIALGDFSRNALDATSQISTNAYQSGLEAMGRALALAPATYGAAMSPYAMLNASGAQQDTQAQNEINGQITRDMFNTFGPMSYLSQVLNMGNSIAPEGSTAVSTGPGAQKPGMLSGALGGGAAGAAMFSGNPYAMGAGALIGMFGL